MNDAEIEQQITGELIDQAFARRDVADRSLMDAAAAMRYSRDELCLHELHARLDDGHLDAPGDSSPMRSSPKPSQADIVGRAIRNQMVPRPSTSWNWRPR